MCNFGGRIMSGYEVIKAQLQMPPPPLTGGTKLKKNWVEWGSSILD